MCPMALKTEVVAAIIYVAVLFGIEIKIYVFTFWVAAGGAAQVDKNSCQVAS